MKSIAIVTGANRGIGLETSRQLARQGVHVLLAAREKNKAAAAAATLTSEGLNVEPLTLDVGSEASITQAAQDVAARHGRVDILVNNAGVLLDDAAAKPSEQALNVWRSTFETNVFGLIATTRAFLPLLRAADHARIVNVSSMLGSMALHSDPSSPVYGYAVAAYNVSKSAVNAWTVQLAVELRDTAIKVNAAHPGHVKTDMGGAAATMEIVDGAKTSVELALLPADGPSGGFFHQGQRLPW